jgi:hypothetical protein
VVKINAGDCINLFWLLRSYYLIGHDVLLSNEPANDDVSLCSTEDP